MHDVGVDLDIDVQLADGIRAAARFRGAHDQAQEVDFRWRAGLVALDAERIAVLNGRLAGGDDRKLARIIGDAGKHVRHRGRVGRALLVDGSSAIDELRGNVGHRVTDRSHRFPAVDLGPGIRGGVDGGEISRDEI